MHIAFLLRPAPGPAPHKLARLQQEVERAGHHIVPVDMGELLISTTAHGTAVTLHGQPLPRYNLFYWGFEWHDRDAWAIVKAVEQAGYPMFMPTTLPLGDKVNQAFLLSKAGLPIPTTHITSLERLPLLLPTLTFPLVLKGRYGARGEQIRWVETAADIPARTTELQIPSNEPFVLQHPVHPLGEDVRAFVIGHQVVAAMVRHAPAGDFRANVSLGGHGTATTLTAEEEAIALRAHHTLQSPVSGVDFIRSQNGPVVLEVNMWPGLQGIEAATGRNIAALMVAHMLKSAVV